MFPLYFIISLRRNLSESENYFIVCTSHIESEGKIAVSINPMAYMAAKGMAPRIISRMGISLIFFNTYRLRPKGGVITAISRFKAMSTPNQIGSNPSCIARG